MDLHTHNAWQGQWHEIAGTEYYFFNGRDSLGPAKDHLPGFWTGSEGLAHPIKDRAGKRYILKSFTIECPERTQRMAWLCRKNLCECHPLLGGAPYQYVGPPVNAQVCPFVQGRTWDSLKDDPRLRLTPDNRLWLAFSLAQAARLLEEGLDMSHSDFSPGNMLIDGIGNGRPSLSLIDFDAFFHNEVPVLPVGKGQTQGTRGYQAPEAVRENTIIRSDRLALAVHIHEFLALGDDQDLGEPDHVFFEQEDLNKGRAEPTPRFKTYWGQEIWDLVRRAIASNAAPARPSPGEWCEAFRTLGTGPPPEIGLLLTAERAGVRKRFDLRSPDIDLASALADPRLQVRLTRRGPAYEASITSPDCVAVLHDPKTGKDLRLDVAPTPVAPNAKLVAAGWELTFHPKCPT